MLDASVLMGKLVTLIWSFVGYKVWLAIILLLFGCALGLPLPEELVVIIAGVLIKQGNTSALGAFSACFIGILAGDILLFQAGKIFQQTLVDWFVKKNWLKEHKLIWAREKFQKYGKAIIIFGRLVPGTRMPIFLLSGLMQMPFWSFALIDSIAAAFFIPLWLAGGYYLQGSVAFIFSQNKWAIVCLGIVVLVVMISFFKFKRR